jgi:hypothetical protein
VFVVRAVVPMTSFSTKPKKKNVFPLLEKKSFVFSRKVSRTGVDVLKPFVRNLRTFVKSECLPLASFSSLV